MKLPNQVALIMDILNKRNKPIIGNSFTSSISSVGRVIDLSNNMGSINGGKSGVVIPLGNHQLVFINTLQ